MIFLLNPFFLLEKKEPQKRYVQILVDHLVPISSSVGYDLFWKIATRYQKDSLKKWNFVLFLVWKSTAFFFYVHPTCSNYACNLLKATSNLSPDVGNSVHISEQHFARTIALAWGYLRSFGVSTIQLLLGIRQLIQLWCSRYWLCFKIRQAFLG